MEHESSFFFTPTKDSLRGVRKPWDLPCHFYVCFTSSSLALPCSCGISACTSSPLYFSLCCVFPPHSSSVPLLLSCVFWVPVLFSHVSPLSPILFYSSCSHTLVGLYFFFFWLLYFLCCWILLYLHFGFSIVWVWAVDYQLIWKADFLFQPARLSVSSIWVPFFFLTVTVSEMPSCKTADKF